MTKDTKNEQEKKEALAILLRMLSKPSSIENVKEYAKLSYQAQKLLEAGANITILKMVDILKKSQLIN